MKEKQNTILGKEVWNLQITGLDSKKRDIQNWYDFISFRENLGKESGDLLETIYTDRESWYQALKMISKEDQLEPAQSVWKIPTLTSSVMQKKICQPLIHAVIEGWESQRLSKSEYQAYNEFLYGINGVLNGLSEADLSSESFDLQKKDNSGGRFLTQESHVQFTRNDPTGCKRISKAKNRMIKYAKMSATFGQNIFPELTEDGAEFAQRAYNGLYQLADRVIAERARMEAPPVIGRGWGKKNS